ncbi:1-deoxy-D-xylulose-5-phosphate synthase [Desulfohalotomaculum tongense]|uniref:1-deoxy-D-xylulose-5-phosphate synthase n=1 Tax=Desulforadius tongensis TaxID=1216062 RepID=UPI001A9C432F|nr:1-deoxy-D-xylulose-5-phosphate synthase [Desulforadius tongensis]MBM7855499.1 1-deoxy-D-xylulose-5-phosphate synthase [Desulforadius tongensis]
MNLLDSIYSPQDVKALSSRQLQILAGELREEIIKTVSKNGGHLAPNLGVVELTLAIHRVFDTSKDKIIFDVGHQCYVHKLLTGRRKEFHTLRQYGGLSGFPRCAESIHDAFGTGHSSTSISAALGMAVARDLRRENYSVVALIGDGAMTGGMAFEALNHAGHLGKDLIVILNDNEMSIGENVGGLSKYLTRIRTDPMYSRGKDEIENLLKKLPIGKQVLKVAERLKDSLKYLVVPGMLFEELGFTYLGPIDGHNIEEVTSILKQARAMKGPVLVHVITRKGKGYKPAEENPDKFHGVGPFDIVSGEVNKKNGAPTYTSVFSDTLVNLAGQDERILAITAAMAGGTGLSQFAERYPERFFDVGIAEQHAVTLAAGMASSGYKPVVAIYSTFMQRAYDQVLHDVCLQNLPVVFAIDRAGIVGDDGATHQGVFDITFMRSIPNLTVMVPKDENELQHMLKTALEHPGPCAVRYPRGSGVGCSMDETPLALPMGKAEVLRRGSDITLVAVGNMVPVIEEAARELAKLGVQATVINARFVKPLDEECIAHYAGRTGRVITVEEHVLAGGFGSAVLEMLESRGLSGVKVTRFGIGDEFVEHGHPSIMQEQYGLTAGSILKQALYMVGKRPRLQAAQE